MKFTLAWAKIAAQNVTLKVATITLAVVAVMQLVTILQLAQKDAIVIDRGCISRAAPAKSGEHTPDEIKAFLIEVLPMRFDSSAIAKDDTLSVEEREARVTEQNALKQRQMTQKIIVQEIEMTGSEITVNADRLISLGKVRSALPYPLKVVVKSTGRTEANPYGLVLTQTKVVEEPKEQK